MNTILKFFIAIILFISVVYLIKDPSNPDSIQLPLRPVEQKETVLVTKVIDGDTIEIEGGQKVRYIGIDTPELHDPRQKVQCFGEESTLKNKELVEGKEIRLEKDISDKDKYGRLLRYVYIIFSDGGRIFVNDYLVRQGFARVSTYPPDVAYQEIFREAEKEARENIRGLWRLCNH